MFTKITRWLLSLVTNVVTYYPKKVTTCLLTPNPNLLTSTSVLYGVVPHSRRLKPIPADLSTLLSPLPFPATWPTSVASRSPLNTRPVASPFGSSSYSGYQSRAFTCLLALAIARYTAVTSGFSPYSHLLASGHPSSLLPNPLVVSLSSPTPLRCFIPFACSTWFLFNAPFCCSHRP